MLKKNSVSAPEQHHLGDEYSTQHASVLGVEIVEALAPAPHEHFMDGTLGLGGHTQLFLEREPTLSVYGFDLDSEHLALAKKRLTGHTQVHYYNDNFANGVTRLREDGVDGIDLCLLDLGICSRHVDQAEKGFSFQTEGPLDMRFSKTAPLRAEDIINTFPFEKLAYIFGTYGEEPLAGKIARAIVAQRDIAPIMTTTELATLVARCKPKGLKKHPATQVFQALRIYVNDELPSLERGIQDILEFLRPGGRLAIISYHSLEDRIVKTKFQELAPKTKHNKYSSETIETPWTLLTAKPIAPSQEEIQTNPRSRSAKLRIIQKNTL